MRVFHSGGLPKVIHAWYAFLMAILVVGTVLAVWAYMDSHTTPAGTTNNPHPSVSNTR